MSKIESLAAAVNPSPATTCPRCEGRGRVRYTRPGGWLEENCTVCRRTGTLDAETAETVQRLMEAGDAALGPVDGPCCTPHEEPCLGCDPFEPSEEDLADYLAWSREREERLLAERIEAGPTFVEKLTALAHQFLDDPDDDMAWVGRQLWSLKARAEWLEAKSGEMFDDRLDAHLDAITAARV